MKFAGDLGPIGADLDRFQATAPPIKDYVDRLVAHNDQRELDHVPTFVQLNVAIDMLEELLSKYMVLLKATAVPSADPIHQEDWQAAFRVPWLVDRARAKATPSRKWLGVEAER